MNSFTSNQRNSVHTLTSGDIQTLSPPERVVYETLQKLFPGQPIYKRQTEVSFRRNHIEYEFRSKGLETPTGIIIELIKDSALPEEVKMVETIYKPSGFTYIPITRGTPNIEEVLIQKIQSLPAALKE